MPTSSIHLILSNKKLKIEYIKFALGITRRDSAALNAVQLLRGHSAPARQLIARSPRAIEAAA